MSMFDIFVGEETNTYTYLGRSVDITITPLSFSDAVKLAEGNQNEKFKMIYESMKKNHPEESAQSIKSMPMAIANKLIIDIFEFNDVPVPDEYKNLTPEDEDTEV